MAELLSAQLSVSCPVTRTGVGELDEVLEAIGASSLRRLFPYDPVFEPRQRKAGLHRWYVIDYSAAPATRASVQMAAIPGVEYSEAPRARRIAVATRPAGVSGLAQLAGDAAQATPAAGQVPLTSQSAASPAAPYSATPAAAPHSATPAGALRPWGMRFGDPAEGQWNLMNDGTLRQGYRRGADINVVPVWDKYTAGSPEVIVAVVDGGIDVSNPDLAPVVLTGLDQSFNFCNDTGEIVPHDHGTHVAGIIGAVNNNGLLGRGVAGGADGTGGVRLLNCQVFQFDPAYADKTDWYEHSLYGSTAEAIVWACNHGAVICNNSWGYSFKTAAEAAAASIDQADKEAIDYFIRYAGCDNEGNQLPGSPMKGGVVFFASGNEGWEDYVPASYDPVISVAAITPGLTLAGYSNYGETVDLCAPGGDYNFGLSDSDCIYSTLPMDAKYVRPGYSTEAGYMTGTSMACPHASGVAALLVSWFGGPGFTADMLKERLIGGADTVAVAAFPQKAGALLDAFGAFLYPDFLTKAADAPEVSAPGQTALLQCTLPADADGCIFLVSADESSLQAAAGTSLQAAAATSTAGPSLIAAASSQSGSSLLRATSSQLGTGFDPSALPADVYAVEAWGECGSDVQASLVLAENATYYALAIARNRNHFAPASAIRAFDTGANHAPEALRPIPGVLLDTIGVAKALYVGDVFADRDGDQLELEAESSAEERISVQMRGDSLVLTAEAFGAADIKLKAMDAGGLEASTTFRAICRDNAVPADIYPMPVQDIMYIATSADTSASWKLYSPQGKLLLEGQGNCSCFAPASIDLSGYGPGIYLLILTIDGSESRHQIVKI